MTFEESMARIEEIVSQLSDKSISLERSLALFSEGVELVNSCQSTLDNARSVIDTLSKKRGEDKKDAWL